MGHQANTSVLNLPNVHRKELKSDLKALCVRVCVPQVQRVELITYLSPSQSVSCKPHKASLCFDFFYLITSLPFPFPFQAAILMTLVCIFVDVYRLAKICVTLDKSILNFIHYVLYISFSFYFFSPTAIS